MKGVSRRPSKLAAWLLAAMVAGSGGVCAAEGATPVMWLSRLPAPSRISRTFPPLSGRLWGTAVNDVIATTAAKAKKSYSTWNLLVTKELSKTTTLYLGADNLFNFYDEDLNIYGTTFKTGLRIKF